jgi:hypothetical protein
MESNKYTISKNAYMYAMLYSWLTLHMRDCYFDT